MKEVQKQILKKDIDFLTEILAKIESNNMHDKLEAKTMLTDQISHMKKRLNHKG